MFTLRAVLLVIGLLAKCSMAVEGNLIEDSFRQCLISQPSSSLGRCLGTGAIAKLQSLDSTPEFDIIDGLVLAKDQQHFREAHHNFIETDPADFRSIMESLNYVFGQRSLRWSMDFIYPGLMMRVAPSGSPGGTLEFAMDAHREAAHQQALKEVGTGRLLARQFLLPFLLGFKFNVATLVPILFALLALLAKKALLISKVALIVSSAFGLGTLLFATNANKIGQSNYHHNTGGGAPFNAAFGGHYNRFPDDEYPDVFYRGMKANTDDQLNVYADVQETFQREETNKGRNFAWSEDEKLKKSS